MTWVLTLWLIGIVLTGAFHLYHYDPERHPVHRHAVLAIVTVMVILWPLGWGLFFLLKHKL